MIEEACLHIRTHCHSLDWWYILVIGTYYENTKMPLCIGTLKTPLFENKFVKNRLHLRTKYLSRQRCPELPRYLDSKADCGVSLYAESFIFFICFQFSHEFKYASYYALSVWIFLKRTACKSHIPIAFHRDYWCAWSSTLWPKNIYCKAWRGEWFPYAHPSHILM